MKIHRFLIDSKQNGAFAQQIQNVWSDARYPENLGAHSGDLLIQTDNKTILIEVKSSESDFVASIMDKRLFTQAEGMRLITPWSFLIHPDFRYQEGRLMGSWGQGYLPHEHWNRNHIEGALTAVQARGVMTRAAYGGIVDTLRRLIAWTDTADIGSVTQEPVKLSPFDKDDQEMVNLLCWFDGVGVTQAKHFLEWCRKKYPNAPRGLIWNMALTKFEDDDDRPFGWTNNQIQKNLDKLNFTPQRKREEWKEELD